MCSGPQLDWDPDIVAAMDDDFNYSDPSNELEDDFVLRANDGEVVTAQPAVYIEREERRKRRRRRRRRRRRKREGTLSRPCFVYAQHSTACSTGSYR